MLINGYSDFEVDYWAAGIIVYFMLFGKYPFDENSQSQYLLFKKICSGDIEIPTSSAVADEHSIDLVKKLLTRDPKKRLGCGKGESEASNGFQKLKNHPFFKDIDYESIYVEKGLKALKIVAGGGPGKGSNENSMQSSVFSSSFSSSNNITSLSIGQKKTEILARVKTQRKKFMFVEVEGHLILLSDYVIRYDQTYDNSSVDAG